MDDRFPPEAKPLPLTPVPSAAGSAGARRTSTILMEMANSFPQERVRLQDLGASLGNRSFGILMLVFALPNAIPIGFPGLSTITGIPLALIALQMMLGRDRPYLPAWLARRSLHRDDFRRLVTKATPWLERLERLLKPRWTGLTSRRGERLLGTFCLALAAVLVLPIPLGNLLPGIGVALLSLALLERDGVLALVGFGAGVVGIALASSVVWGASQAALVALNRLI